MTTKQETPRRPLVSCVQRVVADGQVLHLPAAADSGTSSWREQALCQQTDPELFFPEKGESAVPAKQVCGRCPVQRDCLDYALANDERFGVWGGTSELDRRRMRRKGAA